MASLRRLRRRLLRWERYAAATGHTSPSDPWSDARLWLPGHRRAFDAFEAEDDRRFWAETPEIWLGGPEGETALLADVLGADPTCKGDCCQPDDDAGHGDTWAESWAPMPVVSVPDISEWRQP